ncbi:MAG: SEC-C metal-binding domain-containing protein, partial [Anaerolineae bacterium]
RNDPCWCGSGKKYKHCHMRSDQQGTSGQPQKTPAGQGAASGSGRQTSSKKRRRARR